MYTLIDIANRRILKSLDREDKFHDYISKQLERIVEMGMKYCLSIICNLEEISGDWSSVSKGELLNFEDIFENDKEIIL